MSSAICFGVDRAVSAQLCTERILEHVEGSNLQAAAGRRVVPPDHGEHWSARVATAALSVGRDTGTYVPPSNPTPHYIIASVYAPFSMHAIHSSRVFLCLQPPVHSPVHLPRNQLDAVLCVLKQDSYSTDHCNEAGWLLTLYLIVNFVFNMVMLMVLRTSSATVVALASACRLPLSSACPPPLCSFFNSLTLDIAFTWVWLMGSLAQVLSMWDWLGLAVILLGLFLYSVLPPLLWKQLQKKCFQ